MKNPKVIYITGDRSMDPLTSVTLVNVILTKIGHEISQIPDVPGARFVTGNSKSGIERAVRYMLPEPVLDVVSYDIGADDKPQFDTIHEILSPRVDEVWFIHNDPLSSRIGKSLAKWIAPGKIKMPLQEL